jgi:hypothetical protein
LPQPPQFLVWSILASALAGICLGVASRRSPAGKGAIAAGSVSTAVWLLIAFLCAPKPASSNQQTPAEANADTAPAPTVSEPLKKAQDYLKSGRADLAEAELQTSGDTNDPEVQDALRDFRQIRQLAAAQPWSFGPVIKRTLVRGKPDQQALFLSSADYVKPDPGHPLDFGSAATNSLRAAGADIYLGDAESIPDSLVALDFKQVSEYFPQEGTIGDTIDNISIDLFHFAQEITWYTPRTNDPDFTDFLEMLKKRSLRPHAELIHGTNIYSFITRNGAQGVLQISGVTKNPAAVTIRYKLAHTNSSISTRGPSPAAQWPAQDATWVLAGSVPDDYESSTNNEVSYHGKLSASLRSKVSEPRGFATLMQTVQADAFRGQRVRLSGFVRSQDVASWAALWMRVDGPPDEPLAFDNMANRPIKSTTSWTRYDVVLDVPEAANQIAFGLLLAGKGEVWMADLNFEVVGKDLPTTGSQIRQPLKEPSLGFGTTDQK